MPVQAPPLLRTVFGGLRGYGGDVSPPAALDLVSTRGNTFIIDLRSSRCGAPLIQPCYFIKRTPRNQYSMHRGCSLLCTCNHGSAASELTDPVARTG